VHSGGVSVHRGGLSVCRSTAQRRFGRVRVFVLLLGNCFCALLLAGSGLPNWTGSCTKRGSAQLISPVPNTVADAEPRSLAQRT
jgi:hypothetical protein